MEATITLPNGKELSITKKDASNIFVNEKGCLVVVYKDRVINFGNMPFTLEYDRKEADAQ